MATKSPTPFPSEWDPDSHANCKLSAKYSDEWPPLAWLHDYIN